MVSFDVDVDGLVRGVINRETSNLDLFDGTVSEVDACLRNRFNDLS